MVDNQSKLNTSKNHFFTYLVVLFIFYIFIICVWNIRKYIIFQQYDNKNKKKDRLGREGKI